MLTLTRQNRLGMNFIIKDLFDSGPLKTVITLGDKSITVNHSIDRINQAWYDWQIGDKFIQDAFYFLTADEREFIMSGVTPEEWKEMFKNGDVAEDLE